MIVRDFWLNHYPKLVGTPCNPFFFFQPVLSFAGEHCHPSFYSTAHGAYLSGRSAAQFFLTVRPEEEEVYNLGAASVADLSSWLEEVSMGEKNLEDFKSKKSSQHQQHQRPSQRDAGSMITPR